MVARWNGTETGASARSTSAAELIAKKPEDKLKARVMLFAQPVTSAPAAHFSLTVVRKFAGLLLGRSWMFGLNGTGELAEDASAPESSFSPGSYVAAHELGHGDSLPDEYNERFASFSNNELSFQMNTPGDIFETDGTNWDPSQVTLPDSGIMDGVQVMRNRYFWHSAEFAAAVTKTRFLVKCTQESVTYDKYEVPPHELVPPESGTSAPKRSYVYWPIQDKIDDTAGGLSKYDMLLFAMGEDRFTKDILPRKPVDGTMVMLVKLLINFDATYGTPAMISQILPALRNKVQLGLGDKFFATGKIRVGTPQEWEFKRCLIRLQPRFLIQNLRSAPNADTGAFDNLKANVGAHFNVNVNNAAAPSAAFAGNTLTLQANAGGANFTAQLASLFSDKFAEMFGFANAAAITKDTLKPYVQKVIASGGDAGAF
jgi:hypothetical protein